MSPLVVVINRLRAFLADPTATLDSVDDEPHTGSGQSQLIEHGRRIAEELEVQAPDKVKATLMALLCRRPVCRCPFHVGWLLNVRIHGRRVCTRLDQCDVDA